MWSIGRHTQHDRSETWTVRAVWSHPVTLVALRARTDQTGHVRLFAAVWPDEMAVQALSRAFCGPIGSELRWVQARDWHVTLDFLGSVRDKELSHLKAALRFLGPSLAPAVARLGPSTCVLGESILCVPIEGLDDLAAGVRVALGSFRTSPDSDRPFFGHLTVARSARRRRVSLASVGRAIETRWPVQELTLVASVPQAQGPRYVIQERVSLGR